MLFSQSHHGGGRSAAGAAGGLSPSSWGRPRCRRPSLRPTRTTGKRAQGYVDMSAQPPTLNKPHQPRHRHRGMTLTEFCFLCHLFWGSVSGLWYNPLHKSPQPSICVTRELPQRPTLQDFLDYVPFAKRQTVGISRPQNASSPLVTITR